MKLIPLLFLLIVTTTVNGQEITYEKLDSASKAYVDSIVKRRTIISNSSSHGMLVSFTSGNVDDLTMFWEYLIGKLGYSPNVTQTPTKTGYTFKAEKKSNTYSSKPRVLTLMLKCKDDSEDILSATFIGAPSLLLELYLMYFEGRIREDKPSGGGMDKTYTVTDEIRLYGDKLTAIPHNNKFSNN